MCDAHFSLSLSNVRICARTRRGVRFYSYNSFLCHRINRVRGRAQARELHLFNIAVNQTADNLNRTSIVSTVSNESSFDFYCGISRLVCHFTRADQDSRERNQTKYNNHISRRLFLSSNVVITRYATFNFPRRAFHADLGELKHAHASSYTSSLVCSDSV